jgi:plastocyanin
LRLQEQGPPKLTLGVVGLVAAIVPILLGYFLITGMADNPCYPSCAATSTTTSTSAGPGSSVKISIPSGAGSNQNDPGYSPATIKVAIGTNNTVVWTNNDSAHHTVTSKAGNGSINSGDLAHGAVYNYTFTSPGTYDYICNYHSWMAGTVVVVAGSGPSGVKVSMPAGASNPANPPGYAPDNITVVIGVNNTVTWSNDDTKAPHTVHASSVPAGALPLSSGNMKSGDTYTYTFTVPGTYQYSCDYHSWMTGTVKVVQGK